MKALDKFLDNAMRFLMAIAMGSLVVGGTWQIFTRWILKNPSTFTEEFMRYMLIWASMIGSAYCFYKDKHLALDLVKDKLKGTPAMCLSVFIEVCILTFLFVVFVYGGGRMAISSTNYSPVMHIPFKVLYIVLPLSGILAILGRVLKYIQYFSERKAGK
ncbi:TRAP transporter small permease [Lachnoanaerobaculum umeaense]|uniref:TRAP transporter small permease n=1 Tax=Lachnoanaerobaculum umeaense TaxID=617123 RepID=A0A385Q092_9FIRM|nr:TRAP transporter small permease [Lachnoanaerobaculum umeaense]AYA99730.1 TRAP transporter small permease [Lachnoanaerobaculum umeaense]PZW97731.1 TRAP-type C4-dicarboxylate transport system permease small subunit [Lachnoanaerobaculum umeaense]